MMIIIWYANIWDAKSLPFMSTTLRSADGSSYPISKVFKNGILDKAVLAEQGLPMLAGSFAYAVFMANAAVCASVHHCLDTISHS